MAGDGHRAGTASGSAFDLATAVRGGPERWAAEVDAGWTIAGRPNGEPKLGESIVMTPAINALSKRYSSM